MYTTGVIFDIDALSTRVRILRIKLKSEIEPTPGQFIILWAPDIGRQAFMISDYFDRNLYLAVVDSERATSWLHRRFKRGTVVTIKGPYGRGFSTPKDKKCLIVTDDEGIAPFPFLIRRLQDLNSKVDVVLFFKRAQNVFTLSKLGYYSINVYTYVKELKELKAESKLSEEVLREGGYDMVYVGGSEDIILPLTNLCNYLQIPCEISIDRVVRCNIAHCKYCTFKSLGIMFCKDGFITSPNVIMKMCKQNLIGSAYRTKTLFP